MNSQTLLLESSLDRLEWCQHTCGHVEILDIVVSSERRKGRGRKLVEALISKTSKLSTRCTLVYAITRLSNVIAHQFYEACGFRIVGRLHNFYCDNAENTPESALMYGKDL